MADETIRVGVVGAGANTRKFHIPNLAAQDGVEVVTVANRTRASAQKAADEFSIPQVAEDWEEVVLDPEIDAVCIGTWPYMHAAVTITALQAGKHILCEARMAANAFEAHEMLAAMRGCPGQVAQIVPAPHTLAFDRTIVDMIGDGYVGEIISVDAHVATGSAFPQSDAPVHWRHLREFSGNNIMSMGIWYEAIMRWAGPAATVQAVGQNVVRHRRGEDGRRVTMTIPDHVEVLSRLEQGGQLHLMVSTAIGLAPAAVDVRINGTEGTLRLSDVGGEMALSAGRRGDASLAPVEIDPTKRGAWRVEEEFINAIRGLEPVTHTDFHTAVQYMEWTDAVTKALRTGNRVNLPLDLDG